MARIKLKIGENEIEVDSRDFYVDNQTLGEIIDNISQYMPENQAKIVYESSPKSISNKTDHGLEYLDDAETFKISNKNIIKEIGKKTKDINDIQGQYMGLMKFRPKGWRTFKLCLKKDFLNRYKNLYLTDVFQKLIEKKYLLYGIKYLGKWAEVDSRKDYLIMKKIFK